MYLPGEYHNAFRPVMPDKNYSELETTEAIGSHDLHVPKRHGA